MEDDDEFGDLYTDVLLPFQAPPSTTVPPPPQPSMHRPIDLNVKSGDSNTAVFGAPRTSNSDALPRPESLTFVGGPQNRAGGEDYGRNSAGAEKDVKLGVGSRVSEGPDRGLQDLRYGDVGNGDLMDKDMKFDIEDGHGEMGSDPMIPGLSTGGGGEGDDWDSDSEDDLQIVLNDNNHGPMAMERGGGEGDDEDSDQLVIVANGDANQAMEGQDWGGKDGMQQGADGERKEMGDAGKANGGMVMAPKVGYISHGYHPFHSQFKYVRPGAAPIPGSNAAVPGGPPGQVRPLVNIGPVAGHARGEWRPTGQLRPPMQKGFNPGFGAPAWGAGRGLGGGLDFTLPSHKSVFEVDIDSFEEKPWKYPGIDISDYFNFGLNEESWKDYCKQLEQLRLESTMQSKIRVYESGRTDQGYDPDLPPELAAASGVHDVAAENANNGKSGVDQSDYVKGSAFMRLPLPTGRSIQVEAGYGERLPSADTRPPRIRDSDAIIEIVCQDSMEDDSSTGNEVPDRSNNDPSIEDLRGDEAEEDIAPAENEYFNGFSSANSSRKGELLGRRMHERDRVLLFPPEAPPRGHPFSRSYTPVYSDGNFASSHERHVRATTRDRSQTTRDKRFRDNQKEDSVESVVNKGSPVLSSPIDHKDLVLDDIAVMDGNSEIEKESLDAKNTNDTAEDSGKRKVSSRVEPLIQEADDGEDSKAARSSENSKARFGSSRDIDGAEEEVLQDGREVHMGGGKKQRLDDGNGKSFGRKDVEDRQGGERTSMAPKVREDPFSNLHIASEGFDRRKERDNPDGSWQRRDVDPLNRRVRADDLRKREHGGKVRESEKDENLHSRKQLDNGHNRVPIQKDVISRHRERDDNLKSRYENAEEFNSKRRKDKEEFAHGHRENSNSRKRERDVILDPRERDDLPRIRDNLEREDWHRQKQSREESLSKQGRDEGRSTSRSRRGAEEKVRVVHAREKDEYKGSEKEQQSKDTSSSRQGEQTKRRNHMDDESLSHHRGREDVHVRGNQMPMVSEERRHREERSSSRAVNVSESQRVHERKNKESTRNNKDSGGGDQNTSKRHHQEQSTRVDEMGSRGKSEQTKLMHHSSRKHKEAASSDDEQHESRRGRSKLERWTSHKEKDFSIHSKSSNSKYKEIDANNNLGSSEAIKHPDAPPKPIPAVENRHVSAEDAGEQELKDADKKPLDGKHLDTVEKLKRRSERFKLPMTIEKETSTTKRTESDAPLPSSKSEAPAADSEIKPERPARKRRWISQNLK